MKVLVTGCAGFIGSHVSEYLLKNDFDVFGIDNLNDYYDINRKNENLSILEKYPKFKFKKDDVCTTRVISGWKPDVICHLASKSGVRHSIKFPQEYIKDNIEGFVHIMEEAIKNGKPHVVYASSSSVYGTSPILPFNEKQPLDYCNSPYAVSKKTMESYAKMYHQLHQITSIGLRFFTVYGPRGRPDMAPEKFLKGIYRNTPIDKYGDGYTSRDYTYIDEIVDGVVASIKNQKALKCEVINLGNNFKCSLNDFISLCEGIVGKKAIINNLGNQLGDVPHTYADIDKAIDLLDYDPKTTLKNGLTKTFEWISDNINKI
tara:strand:+ start:77 stop:1027 length:951 start_codon:yes stop_codon:yes gene_type:complete